MNFMMYEGEEIGSSKKKSSFASRFNWILFASMVALLIIGVMFVKSATAIRTDSVHYLYVEMLTKWIPLGMVGYFVMTHIDYRRFVEMAWVLYAFGILLLLLVLIPGIGTVQMGARRWLFGLFQPSEFMKIAIIPLIARILGSGEESNGNVKFFTILGVTMLPMLLIAIQPDLGSALVFIPICVSALFVSGCSQKLFMTFLITGIVLVMLFLGAILLPEKLPEGKRERVEKVVDKIIFPHWKERVMVFVYPDRDPLGAGWNKKQSEIAVGSGGRYGKGYLKGTQNILGFLPRSVSSTDFIFSVIAEETGFTGSCILIVCFGTLLGSIVITGMVCKEMTGRIVCTSISALLFAHIFVNIAMTVGRMPITGIPLPLVSYGGTFTISIMALLGLVQSVAVNREASSGTAIAKPY